MDVPLLRWPSQSAEITFYRDAGMPRLLVIEPGVRPPMCADPLEDWVRLPVDDVDVRARSSVLAARAKAEVPVVDADDVLAFRGRRVRLAEGQAALMRVLVESYQQVVERELLARRVWPESAPARRNTLDLRILRARKQIAPLGLVIRTVWKRGYMLDRRHSD